MDDDVIQVAMGLRLRATLCQPHKCHHCGAQVNHLATHSLSCHKSQGRHTRHAAINDLIKRSLAVVKIPTHLEPAGISRSYGKRPDGGTIVPWKGGRVLVWDATCPDTFAPSHITLATREAGAVADEAERRKKQKYSSLMTSHHFVPIAIETSGVFGSEAITFFKELGQRTKFESGDPHSFHFLIQRAAVAIQREIRQLYSAPCQCDCFGLSIPLCFVCAFSIFKSLKIYCYMFFIVLLLLCESLKKNCNSS